MAGKYRRILSSPCAHYFLNFFQITVFPAFPTLFCPGKSIFLGSYKWLFIYGQKICGIYTSGEIHTGNSETKFPISLIESPCTAQFQHTAF